MTRRELLALALLFLVSLPAVTARLYSSDEVQYFSYLRSLYFDHDVSFENEYRYFHERNIAQSAGFHETFLERQTAAGRRVNYGTIGAALLWSPFYAAADLWTRLTGSYEANGFTAPYVRAVAYASALYGFLAILLSIRAARLLLGHGRDSHRGNTEETPFSHTGTTEETQPSHRGHTEETQPSHRGHTEETQPSHRQPTEDTQEGLSTSVSSPASSPVSSPVFSSVFSSVSSSVSLLSPVASPVSSFVAVAGLAVWLGTPLLFYMYVAPPFSHAVSAFAVALFVNVWLHVRRTWSARGAFALGLCAALMAMVREQDVFIALGPALDFVRSAFINARGRRSAALPSGRSLGPQALLASRVPAAGLFGLLGFLTGYVPQLLAYNALNGYPGPAEHVSRKMFWYAPHGLQVLASPHHGLFFWTPLALLALIGLFFVRDRMIAVVLWIMVASQVYVAGSVESWTVAGAFGQRRFVCLTIVFVIGLAALLHHVRGRTRTVALAVTAVMVWWNIALVAQFATRLMDRQRLEPARNAYHAFVTLPLSAPSLLYRYLTDRASFYESHPKSDGR